MISNIPSKTEIVQTHLRIKKYVFKTPILNSEYLDELAGCTISFKCENLQKIGAFKARGGLNAALSLRESELKRGLCTHSSGNHAQAIALAAKLLGVNAYIVMPNTAPKPKINGVLVLGGKIDFCEPTLEAREKGVDKIMKETGATFIHPFDNYDVIAGQATAAKEILEDLPETEVLIAPVGGGGLLSGTALSAKYFGKKVKVYAGEPEGAADAVLSFKSGKVEKAPYIKTIADGLLTNLSEKTLEIIRENVEDIFIVNDDDIKKAQKLMMDHLKLVIEPSSAVPFAAILKNKEVFKNKKVGLIISGGNLDLDNLSF